MSESLKKNKTLSDIKGQGKTVQQREECSETLERLKFVYTGHTNKPLARRKRSLSHPASANQKVASGLCIKWCEGETFLQPSENTALASMSQCCKANYGKYVKMF